MWSVIILLKAPVTLESTLIRFCSLDFTNMALIKITNYLHVAKSDGQLSDLPLPDTAVVFVTETTPLPWSTRFFRLTDITDAWLSPICPLVSVSFGVLPCSLNSECWVPECLDLFSNFYLHPLPWWSHPASWLLDHTFTDDFWISVSSPNLSLKPQARIQQSTWNLH